MKFAEDKVCEAYVKGKHIRSLFKQKKQVSTTRPLELIHMDIYGPVKTEDQISDIIIKALSRDQFKKNRLKFGMLKLEYSLGFWMQINLFFWL
ncbi:hypothetical protein [Candidatus Phytoplasma australasiaticum]|uniref:hypothetical protein n=1 Tax=Candidatus Phytoplasma australasiaticum TaxID=2754999 RepID=UPI002714A92B|nr:hypothetical protein [Candidatus Phytoplasma australasiaticum]